MLCVVLLMGSAISFAQAQGGTAAAPAQNTGPSLDQQVNLMRQDVQGEKKQIIAANLTMTPAEAEKFWPVYDQYNAELAKIGDQKYALIKQYAQSYKTMTDAQADSLTKQWLALDVKTAQLRQSYQPKFLAVLPGKKVALFEQMDRRLQMIIELQLASQIPMVQP